MDNKLLSAIEAPGDLRRLPRAQLKGLADEVRECVLQNVSRTGGHLSSNLGTVELTNLAAQDPDRSARAHAHAAPTGRHLGLSAS